MKITIPYALLLLSGASLFASEASVGKRIASSLQQIIDNEAIIKDELMKSVSAGKAEIIISKLIHAKTIAARGDTRKAIQLIDEAVNLVGGQLKADRLSLTVNGGDYTFGRLLTLAKKGVNLNLNRASEE